MKRAHSLGFLLGVCGIICAGFALVIVPPLLGILAIVLGYFARKRGETTLGLVAIVLGAIFMIFGMLIGAIVAVLPYFAK